LFLPRPGEFALVLDTWPLTPASSVTSPRWVEMVIGNETDGVIRAIAQDPGAWVDCVVAWVRHLIESRMHRPRRAGMLRECALEVWRSGPCSMVSPA
jgi:hypothetical protein